jgi:hypothetical protein
VPFTVPPITLAPGCLLDRHGLAGHHGLVHRAAAVQHLAVHRHAVAGPHPQAVAHPHLGQGDLLVRAVRAEAAGGLRGEVEQRPDGAAGPLAGAQFEHLPEEHEHGDHRGGLEVDRHRAVHASEAGGNTPGARVATTL